ncbi:zinc transporter ZIP3-like [Neodiprion fabricii]|uniref:zinc transporter ZIP3-like n=1 Tax=Neodiprion fabricii TaxID=2872261 RepID=UPI001ED8F94C|nr:zinc transporter ZIP3-like [Neodiprion fabricii]
MEFNDLVAKMLSMALIFGGSIFIGTLPVLCRNCSGQRRQVSSSLLCLGAGVLFATCALHMLPESIQSLPALYAGLLFCGGFCLLYAVDEMIYFIRGRPINLPHVHRPATSRRIKPTSILRRNDDCKVTVRDTREGNFSNEYVGHNPDSQVSYQAYTHGRLRDRLYEPNLKNTSSNHRSVSDNEVHSTTPSTPSLWPDENETLLAREAHIEPDSEFNASLPGLLAALALHAILEGVAIGVQTETAKVWLLVIAVAAHKLVVCFCLGVEMARSVSVLHHVFAIVLFAGGSVAGIGIGMVVKENSQDWVTVIPALNAVAAGALLYVALSEVLPRERARWQNTPNRWARIWQFIFFVSGIVIIFIIKKYIKAT